MTDASMKLRRTLGKFATGITVVTCTAADGRACGITVNSFTSVSLEPPLVLWNIGKRSNSLEAYLGTSHYAIHVLGSEQEHLARHFARSDHKSFDAIEYTISDNGVPILPDVLARLDCETWKIHEAGDHHIIIGRVIDHEARSGSPVLYFDGAYTRL
jgi:flavin reductase (DIM6/NTAB) family NADH-FMN oxidoreductase RutF